MNLKAVRAILLLFSLLLSVGCSSKEVRRVVVATDPASPTFDGLDAGQPDEWPRGKSVAAQLHTTSNARSWGRVKLIGVLEAMVYIPYGHFPS
jgi:hypothetical protein